MFSLLFGVSFFIQMERASARGQAFAGRFTWRLAVFFAIGMAHHLVYRGDILAIYAALGLVLLLYFRATDRTLLASAAVILLGGPRLLIALWATGTGQPPELMPADAGTQAYWDTLKAGSPAAIAALNLTVMGAMLAGFLLLFARPGWRRVLGWMAPVGQTALTTYVMQSVAGALVFYGYGLNLLGEIGAAAGLALAAVVFAGQIVASHVWLRHFRYGPLEWVWRSATYLRVQPLVRSAASRLPYVSSSQPAR